MQWSIIKFAFYFIKEMFLGKMTLVTALKEYKLRLVLMGLVMLSFVCNVMFLPKTVTIAVDKVKADKQIAQLSNSVKLERERGDRLEAELRKYGVAYTKVVEEKQQLAAGVACPNPSSTNLGVTESTSDYVIKSVTEKRK